MGMVNHNLGIVGECALLVNKPLKQIKADHLPLSKNCMRSTNETYRSAVIILYPLDWYMS